MRNICSFLLFLQAPLNILIKQSLILEDLWRCLGLAKKRKVKMKLGTEHDKNIRQEEMVA